MARKKDDLAKAVSQVRSNIKRIERNNKALLRNAQLKVREYRKELAALKKQGIVSKSINARSHKPTRYMLSKIRKFKDVATGNAMAIRADKIRNDIREKYIEKGTAKKVGDYLIVPKTTSKQRIGVVKGHLATYTPLGFGEERIIFLPFAAKNLNDIVTQLSNHESEINRLKERNEQFGFQLFGHNAKRGFVDANDLYKYLTENYSHLLTSPSKARQAFQEFVLIRFKHRKGMPEIEPYRGTKYYGKKNIRRDDPFYEKELRRRATERKKRLRKKETEAQKIKRLGNQRAYDRANANTRREKRMSKRLLGD